MSSELFMDSPDSQTLISTRKAISHQVYLQLCLYCLKTGPQVDVLVYVSYYLHQDLVAEYLFVVPTLARLGNLHADQVEIQLLLLSQFLFSSEILKIRQLRVFIIIFVWLFFK